MQKDSRHFLRWYNPDQVIGLNKPFSQPLKAPLVKASTIAKSQAYVKLDTNSQMLNSTIKLAPSHRKDLNELIAMLEQE